MMRSRLQEFCGKDSKTREEFIDSILGGLSTVDKDSLKKVIRTWLGVVSTVKSSEISTIFSPYIKRYEKRIRLCAKVNTLRFFLKLINRWKKTKGLSFAIVLLKWHSINIEVDG